MWCVQCIRCTRVYHVRCAQLTWSVWRPVCGVRGQCGLKSTSGVHSWCGFGKHLRGGVVGTVRLACPFQTLLLVFKRFRHSRAGSCPKRTGPDVPECACQACQLPQPLAEHQGDHRARVFVGVGGEYGLSSKVCSHGSGPILGSAPFAEVPGACFPPLDRQSPRPVDNLTGNAPELSNTSQRTKMAIRHHCVGGGQEAWQGTTDCWRKTDRQTYRETYGISSADYLPGYQGVRVPGGM